MINGFNGKYGWLSNFWPAQVEFDGITFPTIEHAYQAAKYEDINTRITISQLNTTVQAKRFKVDVRPGWDGFKLDIMLGLLVQKFTIRHLKQKLIDTGNEYIEETNWWGDTFWGVCNGVGENHLGKLLMKVRNKIIEDLTLKLRFCKSFEDTSRFTISSSRYNDIA